MRHGWFAIPGVQTGERDFSERIGPLRTLLKFAKGKTILDLGCAEGLIGKWFIDAGHAKFLHGLEKHPPYLETARWLMPAPEYNARFDECDFEQFEELRPGLLLHPSYDLVLALNVIQKLSRPKPFLLSAAALARDFFIYSGPHRVLRDPRSGNMPLDIEKEIAADFQLVGYADGERDAKRGHLGVRMIFRRRSVLAAIRKAKRKANK